MIKTALLSAIPVVFNLGGCGDVSDLETGSVSETLRASSPIEYRSVRHVSGNPTGVGHDQNQPNSISEALSGDYFVGGIVGQTPYDFGHGVVVTGSNVSGVVTKFDAHGTALWARAPIGSDGADAPGLSDFIVDAVRATLDGGVLVAGEYVGNIDLGDGVQLAAPPEPYAMGVFVAKYDCRGTASWALEVGDAGNGDFSYSNHVNALIADDFGNAYVAEHFEGADQVVGTTTVSTDAGEGSDTWGTYVVKVSRRGHLTWVTSGGQGATVRALALAPNQVTLYGLAEKLSSFGPPATLGGQTLAGGVWTYDGAATNLASFSATTGAVDSLRLLSSTANATATEIDVLPNGHLRLAGSAKDGAIFDGITISAVDGSDFFVLETTPAGPTSWVTTIPCTGGEADLIRPFVLGLAHGWLDGHAYLVTQLSGELNMSCTIGSSTISNHSTVGGFSQPIVTELTRTGGYVQATGVDGALNLSETNVLGVASRGDDVLILGQYLTLTNAVSTSTLMFGSVPFTSSATPADYVDSFVAKLQ